METRISQEIAEVADSCLLCKQKKKPNLHDVLFVEGKEWGNFDCP